MEALRLAKLADRTPVKIVMSIPPELHEKLLTYSAMYEEAYGVAEPLSELVPAMLGAFLDSDRAFARRRRTGRSPATGSGAPLVARTP